MKEIDIYDKEKLVAVAHRLINVLPQIEKFLDVLERLNREDSEHQTVQGHISNEDKRRKHEFAMEGLPDVLEFFNNKKRIEIFRIISEIFCEDDDKDEEGEENFSKLEKLEKLVD